MKWLTGVYTGISLIIIPFFKKVRKWNIMQTFLFVFFFNSDAFFAFNKSTSTLCEYSRSSFSMSVQNEKKKNYCVFAFVIFARFLYSILPQISWIHFYFIHNIHCSSTNKLNRAIALKSLIIFWAGVGWLVIIWMVGRIDKIHGKVFFLSF